MKKETSVPMDSEDRQKLTFGSLVGEDFLTFSADRAKSKSGGTGPSMNVNPYVWRASLETLSFMPLASADGVGGVIVSDWYSAADKPHERVKVMIYIKDAQLKASAVNVVLTKQTLKNNHWSAAVIDQQTSTELENIILTRARSLHIQAKA
jgi:hypothetical protein